MPKHELPEYHLHPSGGNEYFDTFIVYGKQKPGEPPNAIGLIEKHDRQVTQTYYVAWYFGGNYHKNKTAVSSSKKPYDTCEEAVYFAFFGE